MTDNRDTKNNPRPPPPQHQHSHPGAGTGDYDPLPYYATTNPYSHMQQPYPPHFFDGYYNPYHAATGVVVTPQQDNRKRQRRQQTGAMVAGLFGRGGGGGASKGKKKQSTAQPRPEILVPPRGIGPVHEPNCNDVLSGRGGRINAHAGNVQFREIVHERKKDYLSKETKKLEKAHIAAEIVQQIRSMDPPGRFLKEDADGAWFDIGDAKAIKKVGQALREDAPEIRGDDGGAPKDKKSSSPGGDEKKEGESPKKEPSKKKSPPRPSSTQSTPIVTNQKKPAPSSVPSPQQAQQQQQQQQQQAQQAPRSSPAATAVVSGRGAKMVATSSQRQQPTVLQEVVIGTPRSGYEVVLPPQQRHQPQFLPGQGMSRRVGAAVSGAAAAVMKQQQPVDMYDDHHFEVPAARGGVGPDEAFGRPFHPAGEAMQESSMISGMSGPASVMSGMSGISALTDPISSMSGAEGLGDLRRSGGPTAPSMRNQWHLNQVRQHWEQQYGISGSGTVDMLQSAGLGSSLGRDVSMQEQMAQNPIRRSVDESMVGVSWAGHSLIGGGIRESIRDDSGIFYSRGVTGGGDTGSILSGQGSMGGFSGADMSMKEASVLSGGMDSFGQQRQHQAYGRPLHGNNYYHQSTDHSVADMSMASRGGAGSVMGDSVFTELSDTLKGLDLAAETSSRRYHDPHAEDNSSLFEM